MSGFPTAIIRPGQSATVPATPSDEQARRAMAETETPPTEKKAEAEKKASDTLTPQQKWLRTLEEAKVTEEEALRICSEQMDVGYTERSFERMGGKLVITLRSRDGAHRSRLRYALDSLSNPVQTVYNETVLRTNLNSSIVRLRMGEKVIEFPHPAENSDPQVVEEKYRERALKVDRMSENILDICYTVLGRFDAMVSAALSGGSIEGF